MFPAAILSVFASFAVALGLGLLAFRSHGLRRWSYVASALACGVVLNSWWILIAGMAIVKLVILRGDT